MSIMWSPSTLLLRARSPLLLQASSRPTSALLLSNRTSSPTTWTTTRLLSDQQQPETRKSNVVKKRKKGKEKGDASGGHSRHLDLVLRALDAPSSSPPKPESAEELELNYQIGRAYVIGMFERHNALQHDLACKMKLKSFAIKMLPRNTKLKEEALKIDYSNTPPLWRPIPVDTPPIPNFDPSKFIHRDED